MPVLSSAFDEGATVRFVPGRRIGAPLLSFPGHAVAFEIAQMRVDRAARDASEFWPGLSTMQMRVELHHPRLDDDASHPERAGGVAPPCAALCG